MPGEDDKKPIEDGKKTVNIEVQTGILNETPVQYSSNNNVLNYVSAASTDIIRTEIHKEIRYDDDGPYVFSDYNPFSESTDANSMTENMVNVFIDREWKCAYAYDYQNLFDINIQRETVSDPAEICNNMKSFILENKDSDPEKTMIAIGTLQTMAYTYYDHGTNNIIGASGFTRKHLGNTSEEILDKLYSTPKGEMLEGFVCSTISDFTMRMLHECDIEAVMFCGGHSHSDHTTLLYKQSEGKYVYVDDGKFAEIEANNIKDAAMAAHRKMISPGDFGYIMFVDEENSYQEYSLADESVWGHELDKRDYNQTYAKLPVVEDGPSIKVNYNRSALGGNEINVTGLNVVNRNENSVTQNKISLGFKNNDTDLLNAYSYKSIGLKYEKTSLNQREDNTTTYKNSKTIVSATEINDNAIQSINSDYWNVTTSIYDKTSLVQAQNDLDNFFYNQNGILPAYAHSLFELDLQGLQDTIYRTNRTDEHDASSSFRNFALFNRSEFGRQIPITDNLSTTSQFASTVGLSARPFDGIIFCGDLRLTADQSLNYQQSFGKDQLTADINAGLVTDMSIKTGVLDPGVAFGGKGNADISFTKCLTDNFSVGANASGYIVATPVSTDYGATGGLYANYRNNNCSIFASANAAVERQNLHIGQLNEQTENNIGLNAVIGVKNRRGRVQVGYNGQIDRLNPTKNRRMFNVGVDINL